MSGEDEKYMRSALKLARRGIGSVEPNPAVGCLIVKSDRVIGKGWHKKFGGPHAEINALEDCKTLGVSPAAATMYVTLEPCCHRGKTAACTEAVIAAGISKVVVAMIDPSGHAGGRGIGQLRSAGIEVQTGVCETEAKLLNAPFVKFVTTGRPWVILKWAQSIDGRLAWANKPGGEERWISNERSRKDAHKLRRRAQAVLVGINTVLTDDPLLTPRPVGAGPPIRIVLDSFLRIPGDSQLLTTTKKAPVLVFAREGAIRENPERADEIVQTGATLLGYPDTYGRSNLHFLLAELCKRGAAQLLVEGGPTVLTSFLKEQLTDEICVYIAPRILGAVGNAEITEPMAEVARSIGLRYVNIKAFGDDVRISGVTDSALRALSIQGDRI